MAQNSILACRIGLWCLVLILGRTYATGISFSVVEISHLNILSVFGIMLQIIKSQAAAETLDYEVCYILDT